MYKLFMTLCILVNGAVECTDYNDSEEMIYQDLAKCEADAGARFYGLNDVFRYYNQEYESLEVGCVESED